jgi:DNA-binding NarL/FixJ family response regulator
VRLARVEPGISPRPRSVAVGGAGANTPARKLVAQLLKNAGFSVEDYAASRSPALILLVLADATDADRTRNVRAARETCPGACVVTVVPAALTNASLRRVLLAGATGIVLDGDLERALVPTASAALAGQLAVPVVLVRQIAPRPLSHREKQILALVMRGRTNNEIAQALFLAESTVKTHLSSAFRKLDARSRSEAVTRIIDPESGYAPSILEMANDVGEMPTDGLPLSLRRPPAATAGGATG